MSREYWENIYRTASGPGSAETEWLDRYGPLFAEEPGKQIIDLGCGSGVDSVRLLDLGFSVISCDFSEEALKRLASSDSRIVTKQFNIKEGLPFADSSARIVLASLSLHYFDWNTTRKIAAEIRRVLEPGGCLICRLNSVNDINHGAGSGIELEKNYYNIDGNCKRFFDSESINSLFRDWELLVKEECSIERFTIPKKAWEVAARKPLEK